MRQAPMVGKTGTALEDIPASIQIISHAITEQRGETTLREAIRNVSGLSEGGPSSYGFFDRFLMRGLDPQMSSDGFTDGDQINGFPHSLNGIDHIEVLKGPGSALLGSGPAGGTINIVHLKPQPVAGYGITAQGGSYDAFNTNFYATGPMGQPGLDYRVDGFAEHANAFRNLSSKDFELRPDVTWATRKHTFEISVDGRHIDQTPDAYGLIYLGGTPIDVSRATKYSTPFSFGNQDLARLTLSDVWIVGTHLTINNRFSYLYRDLDLQRNSGGAVSGDSSVSRQFRQQHDVNNDFDYQVEPLWKFSTGTVGHALLTGAEFHREHIGTNRSTADVPDIANIFDPQIPEQSVGALDFECDAKHSCDNDDLSATYVSAYVTDQLDLTSRWKLRLGLRQDWWSRSLTPNTLVPGRLQPNGQPFEPGVEVTQSNAPVSWNAGMLYRIAPGVSPFIGVATSHLANFNSESNDKGIAPPENAIQYEGGVKLAPFGDRLTVTASAFRVRRENVFSEVGTEVFFNDQETWGGEVDAQWRATSRWNILANVTAQHAELTDNPSQPSAQGKQPEGVPLHIANLWTTYDLPLGGLDGLRLGGGVSYRDRIFGNATNTNEISAFTVIDAVVGVYRPAWDVAVEVNNLTDKTYFTTALGAGARVGDPRSVLLKVGIRR
ncbi:MAG: TonB-dependent receptor, partial [Gemmatimonadaceae bacterium]